MSFFGGGTDMESFFKEYGGSVLSATFDKYCYVNTFIQVVYRFSLLLVRLQYKSKIYSTLSIINKIVYVVLALAFLQSRKLGDSISLILALTIAAAVCLLVSIACEKSLWFGKTSKNDQCEIDISSLVKYAFPYVFSMGITILFQTADKLALNAYGTYSDKQQ